MLRNVSLEEISDGRLYGLNDMAKLGCNDCSGCSSCCRGMGNTIVLDPYDVWRLTGGLGMSLQQLLAGHLELNVVDGIILPNLKLAGDSEQCTFLNEAGRCSIHPYRPGICRLFPLGRYYEEDGFRYILQVHECEKQNRSKVKIRKWMDTPDMERYDAYIADWHAFLSKLRAKLEKETLAGASSDAADEEASSQDLAKSISMYVLQQFYLLLYDTSRDFYSQYEARMAAAKEWSKNL
ncbi:YkgJ family cysteine cluster protein [Ventrimonas sp. CLA-AP-H27]|uniref:YkgJ family cysteine cluster protein n=1 Tax=Ventrimonas faecis TaxID=3133170 RepID=A0ABV1HP20_9FIRM